MCPSQYELPQPQIPGPPLLPCIGLASCRAVGRGGRCLVCMPVLRTALHHGPRGPSRRPGAAMRKRSPKSRRVLLALTPAPRPAPAARPAAGAATDRQRAAPEAGVQARPTSATPAGRRSRGRGRRARRRGRPARRALRPREMNEPQRRWPNGIGPKPDHCGTECRPLPRIHSNAGRAVDL